ncbi:MAG: shikimate dehydrogenase [Gemmatimonadetes bacterium]|nr:shikimate dehydrogenase [Gemmatimonadota bacterium]
MPKPEHPQVLALLGDPVAHSLSPPVVNAACAAAGVKGVYVAIRCGEDDLGGLIRGISRGGAGGNVTLPYKERAARIVEVPTAAVRRSGACNTFWRGDDGRVHGDNTDVAGFQRAVEHLCGRSAQGMRVLLLGAGGAARAVLLALVKDGVDQVTVRNRSLERARRVARRIGGFRARVANVQEDIDGESFDLVVNATSLGMKESDGRVLNFERLRKIGYVLDLVYRADSTRLVQSAVELGIPAADGKEMLVQQAAVAFERWWKRPAPIEVMREAVAAACE